MSVYPVNDLSTDIISYVAIKVIHDKRNLWECREYIILKKKHSVRMRWKKRKGAL